MSALRTFLKRTGSGPMAGTDSACYYWGYVMLEKSRIDNGVEKSEERLKAEEVVPGGRRRLDPSRTAIICGRPRGPEYLDNLRRGPGMM